MFSHLFWHIGNEHCIVFSSCASMCITTPKKIWNHWKNLWNPETSLEFYQVLIIYSSLSNTHSFKPKPYRVLTHNVNTVSDDTYHWQVLMHYWAYWRYAESSLWLISDRNQYAISAQLATAASDFYLLLSAKCFPIFFGTLVMNIALSFHRVPACA